MLGYDGRIGKHLGQIWSRSGEWEQARMTGRFLLIVHGWMGGGEDWGKNSFGVSAIASGWQITL